MIRHRYGDRYLHNGALEISFRGLELSEDLLLIGHFIFAITDKFQFKMIKYILFIVHDILPTFQQLINESMVLTQRIHGTTMAATHRCQMKRHAEFWTATKKDDNLTALDQENMVGKRSPIDKHRDVEVGSFLLDFQVQWVAFAESYHSTPELNIIY
ncbi:hypothetical protein T11_17251 [Trichinella zimbabwensis]|uniref:Uncharacterized protein n=1 Tax=Trichinella zimbabwensis TaxID=268475 RepID=A0A0V1H089_9BILA|nr:hypothetical protein T11_17251 [Trichinella zimbabwensis]